MSQPIRCIARISEPPHYFDKHSCGNKAKKHDILCGTHRNQLDRHNDINAKYGFPPSTPEGYFK